MIDNNFCVNCRNILDLIKIKKKDNLKLFEFDTPIQFIDYFNKNTNNNNYKINFDYMTLSDFLIENTNAKLLMQNLSTKDDTKRSELLMKDYTKQLQDKQYYLDLYNELLENNVDYYSLICSICKKKQPLNPNNIIYKTSFDYSKNNDFINNIDLIINDPIIPETLNYICLNNNCKSNTNNKFKMAKIYKINNSQLVVYICKTCKNYWYIGNI